MSNSLDMRVFDVHAQELQICSRGGNASTDSKYRQYKNLVVIITFRLFHSQERQPGAYFIGD
jgi:hypothetical protein